MTTQPDAAKRAAQTIVDYLSMSPEEQIYYGDGITAIIRREFAADLDALRAERDAARADAERMAEELKTAQARIRELESAWATKEW